MQWCPFFSKVAGLGQGQQLCIKQTPSQLFFCKFCEIFIEHPFAEQM